MRKQCKYGMIDFQHEFEYDCAARKQITIYKQAAVIEVMLMVDEDGWGGFGPEARQNPEERPWAPAKSFTTRNSKNKDIRIWRLLDADEQNLYNEFLDMWGTWRKNNSTVIYVRITRDGKTHRADYTYTKHDINDYIQVWDDEKNLFNDTRSWKNIATDEQLREDVIPSQLESVNMLIEYFRADALSREMENMCKIVDG